MWQQDLNNKGYQTLYFNAWENDFDSNPLVALMGELNTLTKTETEQIFKSLLKKASVITNNILPALFKAIAAKYIDTEIIQSAIENTTKAATEILDDEVKDYVTKKEGLVDFKNKLSEFVDNSKGGKPIIFIIDELDRCRPSYAVEALEQIKHFFSVKGIVFVLSIDKVQLGNAVRGFYGSDKIDANEYLRRFIDLEYTIPEPDTKVFCNYLYEYFGFDQFFNSEFRRNINGFKGNENLLKTIASKLFENAKLTLRQQEKVFARTRIVLNSFNERANVFPNVLIFLVFIKEYHTVFYNEIKMKKLTLNGLIEGVEKIVPQNVESDARRYFIHLEANLISMYNNSVSPKDRKELIQIDESNKTFPIVKSELDKPDNIVFSQDLQSFDRSIDYYGTSLDFLINKIDLTEPLDA